MLAVQRGDATEASIHYAELESKSGIMLLFISTDRVLGLLAQTMGNLDQAMNHFEDALSFCRKAGYRPNLAWTCHDYANALLQRNILGDRGNAELTPLCYRCANMCHHRYKSEKN